MNEKEFVRKAGLKYSEVRRFVREGAIHSALILPGCWGGFESRNEVFFAPRARGVLKRGELDAFDKYFWFEGLPEGVHLESTHDNWWEIDETVYSPYPCEYYEIGLPDPVWRRVDEEEFFRVASTLFKLDPPACSLREFKEAFEARKCPDYARQARFFIFPTPHNRWGYVYQTVSGKQLVYDGKTIYTRSMRIDRNVVSIVASVIGEPRWDIREPRWVNRALNHRFEYTRIDPLTSSYDYLKSRGLLDILWQQKKS